MKMFSLSWVMLFVAGAVLMQHIAINNFSFGSEASHLAAGISNSGSNEIITEPHQYFSSNTDYFRSFKTGNWDSPATWESSPTGTAGTWVAATLAPDENSTSITIMTGHTVTLTNAAFNAADQLTILSGGVLVHSNGASFTLHDGPGTDMTINSGGTYVLNGTQPLQVFPLFTVDVKNGGIVRVDSNDLSGQSDAFASGANGIVIFETGSIYEWNTPDQPKWDNRTYFTPGNNTTYRFSQSPASPIGGVSPTVVYGHIEANVPLAIGNAGTKTFVNGITGLANIDASASGQLIINGPTAEIGGTGSLTLPVTGLQIGSAGGTTVTVSSNKTVTGNISLVSTAYVDLGINNLTVTGTITGGSTNAFIKTSSTGVLTLNTVTSKTFPIGNSSYNPLVISNGSAADYSARVIDGISPAIAFPTYGINRTWNLYASVSTIGVNVSFQYAGADANAGVSPQPQPMEILINTDPVTPGPWSIIPGNTGISPGGADPYTVSTATPITIANNSQVHYALGKNGGWILPIDCIISTQAQKINNTGLIKWMVNSCSAVRNFEVQRSVNNSGFQTIGIVNPVVNPVVNQTDFNFTDAALASGTDLYRIKVNGITGSSKYSNTVAIIQNSNDILITTIAPNPVHNSTMLTVSSGRPFVVDFKVYDMSGKLVKQWQAHIAEGNNNIEMNVPGLPAGVYSLFVSTPDGKTVSRFVKQ
jgi:hypothetical protein